ncbi:MAG: rubredoxin [Prolixibacteraceae bacterium]
MNKRKNTQSFVVQQCKNCKTIYDQRFGDILANIQAGTAFEKLPENYSCQICESPKSEFEEIGIAEFV